MFQHAPQLCASQRVQVQIRLLPRTLHIYATVNVIHIVAFRVLHCVVW
jgi:hypothetical protein